MGNQRGLLYLDPFGVYPEEIYGPILLVENPQAMLFTVSVVSFHRFAAVLVVSRGNPITISVKWPLHGPPASN